MKRTLGFKYGKEEIILSLFDKLAFDRNESEPGITKALTEAWCKKKENETESYRYSRICLLCQFSSYMNDLGYSSYVPKQIPFPQNTFIPYIYSPKEIHAIFDAADHLALRLTFLNSTIFSIPTLLRLLYGTGLRISEALALKEQDVNLEGNYLCVRDSKNGKERVIPFSGTLSLVLKDYLFYKNQLPVKPNQSNSFFVKLNGEAVKYTSCLGRWFNMCLDEAGITYTDRSRKPRIHDLRHTFACHSLMQMADSGIDIYVSLPILSTYLGHQSLNATNHYVRLTSMIYPELQKDIDMTCLNVFPQ
ncbi:MULTISPECIES: tyrosine-type recombinase/integrase [unclassified Dysgonomonas]|uniref:tyrosine-type recombinase/integrase n=1 Tax=unclassified Dysgonomonas TaxID=2630389 RepID=UPI002475D19A|nr:MULTISPECIES: tyrosine-type recombinase/integrase [unclassified Dysgonomonas]